MLFCRDQLSFDLRSKEAELVEVKEKEIQWRTELEDAQKCYAAEKKAMETAQCRSWSILLRAFRDFLDKEQRSHRTSVEFDGDDTDALYSTDRVTDYMKECEGLQSDSCMHAFEEAFIKIQALRSISDADVSKNDVLHSV